MQRNLVFVVLILLGGFVSVRLLPAGTFAQADAFDRNASGVSSFATTACVSPAANLVSWWQGEGNALDVYARNNGTLENGVSFVPGKVGEAFSFDGLNDYVDIPASSSLNIGTGTGITIETWINPANIDVERPLVEWTSGHERIDSPQVTAGVHLWMSAGLNGGTSPGNLYANLTDVTAVEHRIASAPGLINPNVFSHVALTYDRSSGGAKLFVNGTVVADSNLGSFVPQTSLRVYLGHRPFGVCCGSQNVFFSGSMDEVSLYNRALSVSEIQSIYSAGSAGKCFSGCGIASGPPNDTALVPRDGSVGSTGPGSNAPIGNRIPVILIHGIHGNAKNGSDTIANPNYAYFENLVRYLNLGGAAYNNAFKTYSFHYVSDRYTTKQIGRALRDRLDATAELAGKDVIIIAHSMGGIVARHFMLQSSANGPAAGACSGARVQKLITLATPHHGTYGANKQSRGDRFALGLRSIANALLGDIDRRYWRGSGCEACIANPQQLNRRSLLWDNYDGLLNLYANEGPTDIPTTSNYPGVTEFYNNKIIAYSGVLSPNDPSWQVVKQTVISPLAGPASLLDYYYEDDGFDDFKLAIGAYFTDSVFLRRFSLANVPTPGNDGLVPVESARFDGAGSQLMGRTHCVGYNHLKMEVGDLTQCSDGKMLFKSVRDRIIGTSVPSPALFTGPIKAGFGNQTYGPGRGSPVSTIEVALSNMGDEPLQVTSLSIAGTNADQFAIANLPSLPFSVGPMQSVPIAIAFNPTSPGPKVAELRAGNSSSNATVVVQLTAAGLPTACELTVPTSIQYIPSGGGNGEVVVGNISCPWTVTTTDDWIHPSALSDRVAFTVDSNPGQAVRHGSITISVYGRSYVFSISQDGANSTCWLSLSSDQAVVPIDGGTGSFSLTSPGTCGWTLSSNAPWLVPNQVSTQGSGMIGFTASKNFGSTRSGVITIQGQNSSAEFTVLQLQGRQIPFDYDSDGRTDFSVFRPSGGAWYLQRSTAGFQGLQFGANGDKLTPADYDGDGKTDISIYRSSTGIWYILNSSNSTVTYPVFGATEDLPAPGDYDGDGKADLTVFRPSQGQWYRLNSSNGSFFAFPFGATGDVPTVGDFDGDGKNDIGIWRSSNGDWYNIRSSNGSVFGERFGQTGDRIAPADYDGDGKTDIAIYRPSTGLWVVRNSATATYAYYVFGAPSDIPISGDYDGDGKADIGVWRPSDGTWYIQRSSNSQVIVFPWGQNGDRPTPAAFGN